MTEFREEQVMDQLFVRLALLIGPMIVVVVYLAQYLKGESDTLFPVGWEGLMILILVVGPTVLLWNMKMKTLVDDSGIYVKWWPFGQMSIQWSELSSAEAREYNPISEYGGWGIRWGKSGKAYNVKGNKGVQLVLKSGKRILIGSQRSEELAGLINSNIKSN